MRRVDAWMTSDGAVFTDQRTAEHHAEERYGEALTALAHDVARVEKYREAYAFVEAAIPRFVELAALAADRVVINQENSDDE